MSWDTYERKMQEARELREMPLQTESARMFRDAMATDLENEAKRAGRMKKSEAEDSLKYIVKNLVAYLDHLDSPVPECRYRLNKLKEWLRTGRVPEEMVVPS